MLPVWQARGPSGANINPLKPSVINSNVQCHKGLTYHFQFLTFGTLALRAERQSARMSEIEMIG